MASRKTPPPQVRSIEATSARHAGRGVQAARPGDSLRVRGSGFGRFARRVTVCFDEQEVPPFALPFSDDSLFVSVPAVAAPTQTLSVRVGKQRSRAVPLAVRPLRRRRARPGAGVAELFAEIDAFAANLAAFARRAAPATAFGAELQRAAAMADGTRAVMRRNLEILMQWAGPQAAMAPARVPFEAVRTIERLDEAILDADLSGQVRGLALGVFGPASVLGRLAGEKLADWLFGGGAGELAGAIAGLGTRALDLIGFALTEGAKVLDGIENILKIYVPSASVGVAGIVAIDVSFSPGEGVSAFARAVDFVAQIFAKIAELADAAQLDGRLDRAEEKLDRQGGALIELDRKSALQESKLDQLETKADFAAQVLEQLESKADRLEAKSDRDSELLGLLETKADRLEAKADRDSELLGLLEAKADRISSQLGALEEKADRAEQKADALESKADRAEQKLDRLEAKADRLESKADRSEAKLDAMETKADRAELKLDRLELKADRAEAKLDRQEEKLDREEEKLDRLVLPVPLEGSLATQQGSGQQLSAAVAATRGLDNAVHLRAAIDLPAARLDDETAWSGWVSFGRPGGALGLLELSLDLNYAQGSDVALSALLSARDQRGAVFHRAFPAQDQSLLLQPARWSDWQSFLMQP